MKKKFALLSLAFCLALGIAALSGCASSQDSAEETTDDATEAAVDNTIVAENPGTYETATLEDVKAALEDDNAVVLDARPQTNFSGWSTADNAKGGHIDGAHGFSANWLTCTYDDKANNDGLTRVEYLAIEMDEKDITADTKVIVYDENGEDAQAVADYLASQGVTDITLFNLADWDGELTSYDKYQMYVPAEVVKKLIDGETVDEIGEVSDLKIVEFSWGTTEESGFLDGHVPGAVHINSDDVDDEDNMYILDDDSDVLDAIIAAGITPDSTVVVTGAGLFACHMATILEYEGVENVYVMSGGANAWADAGYELETTDNTPEAANVTADDFTKDSEYIDTVQDVQDKLGTDGWQLVDTRTYKEYTGETSGYTYVPEAGRPDGAIFGQGDGSYQGEDANASSMVYYENPDGTMRDASELIAMWEESGLNVDNHMSFFCGGGYRAAEVMWDARVMGLDDTSLYNDGWSGWVVAGLDAVKGE